MFATNLDSHFLSVKYFLPAMRKKKWGRFIGISSNMVGLAMLRGQRHGRARHFGSTRRTLHPIRVARWGRRRSLVRSLFPDLRQDRLRHAEAGHSQFSDRGLENDASGMISFIKN